MQDNYNKDLENKGWAQMSAILDKERPGAVSFWKRAWQKLALGLVLLLGVTTTLVLINQNTDSNQSAVIVSENAENKEVVTISSSKASTTLHTEKSAEILNKPINNETNNTVLNNISNKSQSTKTTNYSPSVVRAQTQFLQDRNAEILDVDEASYLFEKETSNPPVEQLLPILDIQNEVNTEEKPKEISLEPIALLNELPQLEERISSLPYEVDCNTIMPKAKRIENWIVSFDNGYDLGLKSYSSALAIGVDIPLKDSKWNLRPSIAYNSLRSDLVVTQNSFGNAAIPDVNNTENITSDADAEWTYATNAVHFDEALRNEKSSSFFTDHRINEIQLQLRGAYRLNHKWSIIGGLTPTYLLKNQNGLLPSLRNNAVLTVEDQNPNGSLASLGIANQWNLNGQIGLDYQINPRFSVTSSYNHGWIRKARTDLINTKLKSINLTLNYHF